MAKKDEVAEKPQDTATNLPAVNQPRSTGVATLGGYDMEDIGSGFEDFTISDLTIPFLAILQSGSPQVKEEKGTYVPGAKAGMFMNTVTNELFDGKKGVQIIPVHRKHSFIEWIPRDQGGGFVAEYSTNDPRIVELRKATPFGKIAIEDGSIFAKPDEDIDHTGNDIVETFTVFALIVKENGTFEPMVLSFASTAIKPYKKWMTTAKGIQIPTGDPQRPVINPPMFSHLYRARTQFQEKNNYDWFGWQIGFENGIAENSRLDRENPLFKAAKELRDQVVSGNVKEARETAIRDDEDAGDTDKF
jgi:hypothetical protein